MRAEPQGAGRSRRGPGANTRRCEHGAAHSRPSVWTKKLRGQRKGGAEKAGIETATSGQTRHRPTMSEDEVSAPVCHPPHCHSTMAEGMMGHAPGTASSLAPAANSHTAIKIQLRWPLVSEDFCSGLPPSPTQGAAEALGASRPRWVSSWRSPAAGGGQGARDGGWGQDGGLGTVMVGGAGAPGGAPAKASGCHIPDRELPVSVWAPLGPWLSQEPPLVPAPESDPGSLSEDCPRLACPRQAGALEDCAGVQFGVLGAVGRSLPGVTSHGGLWADSGGRPQPGKVVPPRVCARHHGTGAGHGLSQASACPRGVLSAPSGCTGLF